ncbi:MAG: 3-beta hydroxysteroid dehydrogenase/isomerase family protein [Marmoricola sp.]|nr:3-beta hydroxysteroid dehydrogenase/isomerase family protein [Marmoricola sp.]
MSNSKTIVVTGANGLLGRYLLVLLAPTHDVHAIVHAMPADPVLGVTYRVIDFAGDWNFDQLPAHADAVVHLAQSAHFRDVPARALEVFQVNVASTARLLDYAWRCGVDRFLYASSGGIYGAGDHAFHENSPIVPPGALGYYLGSKVSGEVLAQSYAAFMKVMILRFFFIYGPRQNRAMLIPRLVDSIRAGRPISMQGEEGLRLNPIHVADAAAAVLAALESEDSAIYNIGGPQILSLRQLCTEIEGLTGCSANFTSAPGEARDVIGDISAMRAALHEPTIFPASGLKDML